jgi:hypothetical protein
MGPELGEVRHLRIKRRDVAGFQSDLTAVLFQCQHPGELPADEALFDAAQRLVKAVARAIREMRRVASPKRVPNPLSLT